MAKITRIKASETDPNSHPDTPKSKASNEAVSDKALAKKVVKKDLKKSEKAKKGEKSEKSEKKSKKQGFFLFRPFVSFGRYIRGSWREIRQVRWPSRKATWKLVLAIFAYTALFVILITLLDALFTWLFEIIIK